MAPTHNMEAGRQQGEELLAAVVELAQQRWRDRLIAAYALGSLAHDGFSPQVSDIDVGLVLGDPLLGSDSDGIMELASSMTASDKRFADRLSVFWGSVASLSGASAGGRFPPLDRLDLITFGRMLVGRDIRGSLPSPTHRDLVLAGAEFALRRLATDEVIAKLKDPQALAQSDLKTLTKLILFPVRFMFTARTGEVGRNEAAVEHFVAAAEGASPNLARLALEWRNAAPRASDRDAIQAIAAGAIPLYQEFLLDHERRLREYGRMDLAEAFHAWQQRLLA